jgi:hypothetical protein
MLASVENLYGESFMHHAHNVGFVFFFVIVLLLGFALIGKASR